MAIQFVGSKTATASGALSLTSLTGGIASAPATGDVVIVVIGSASTSDLNITLTTPAGYTEVADLYANDTLDTNMGVYYKVMGATPDTSVTIPAVSTPVAVVYVLRGIDTTTPLDATTTTATGINSGTIDPPSITTVTAGAWVLAIGSMSHGTEVGIVPSGFSNMVAAKNTAGNTQAVYVSSMEVASPAATDPPAYGGLFSSTSDCWTAATMAIRPLAARLKVWDGASWALKPAKVWNGTSWVEKPVKFWNGTAWTNA